MYVGGVGVRACVRACVRARVRVRARACMRACVRARVYVLLFRSNLGDEFLSHLLCCCFLFVSNIRPYSETNFL